MSVPPIENPTVSEATNDAVPAIDCIGDSGVRKVGNFSRRHIGPGEEETTKMLSACGFQTLDELAFAAVPESIQSTSPLNLPAAKTEYQALHELREIGAMNAVARSYIGMGYHECIVPPVIQRNVLENPGWYTQYTPYQAEIAQGRLEGLLTFQTMVCDLTGMDVANASLLDEGTAAAEAMALCHGVSGRKHRGENRRRFFVSNECNRQTQEVVATRAEALGLEAFVNSTEEFLRQLMADNKNLSCFGLLLAYPLPIGAIEDYSALVAAAKERGVMVVVVADLLALTLLRPPGEFGADIAVGSSQRFGVPLGFGGPHAAFFATRDEFKRQMPGRIVGVSRDVHGRPAYRLSLQTREQHIRRDKATSNICTAQALLANMAAFYAVYHGPEGLRDIARRAAFLARVFAAGLGRLEEVAGVGVPDHCFFDTVKVSTPFGAKVRELAAEENVNLALVSECSVVVAFDETKSLSELEDLWRYFNLGKAIEFDAEDVVRDLGSETAAVDFGPHNRTSDFLTSAVFHRYRSETEMLRYLRRLESKDLSLTTSMIPLGSCTMKLNASAEMFPLSWPEFANLHPFAPEEQTRGYDRMFQQLEKWLSEITGFHSCSLQPNAGSQGEFAGLLAIRKFHESRGDESRDVCLIPMSAHGTNPASAVMAGFVVKPVACDEQGNIDLEDLRAKSAEHAERLGGLMVTYPSTHGVFETGIRDICEIIHKHGGQVYMDGANLNAQVGLCRPGEIGADVCHINLHKTFCIPHGGGGPGMGPICCAEHLAPFLPGHPVVAQPGRETLGPISAAPWGSPSIMTISWMYIAMMGPDGLKRASQIAILNANYIAQKLDSYFPVLYKGSNGLVAHECILDLRRYKTVTVEDVAKRLMDYGFHAPTISWPVAGTMMVEPTESESKAELDRFCDALILIHGEIEEIESGRMDVANNPLKNAPHTAESVVAEKWERPYSRERAAFPAPWLREHKFWPAVGRIDNVYGDRNLVCTCEGMEAFAGGE